MLFLYSKLLVSVSLINPLCHTTSTFIFHLNRWLLTRMSYTNIILNLILNKLSLTWAKLDLCFFNHLSEYFPLFTTPLINIYSDEVVILLLLFIWQSIWSTVNVDIEVQSKNASVPFSDTFKALHCSRISKSESCINQLYKI